MIVSCLIDNTVMDQASSAPAGMKWIVSHSARVLNIQVDSLQNKRPQPTGEGNLSATSDIASSTLEKRGRMSRQVKMAQQCVNSIK
jgi:hypothetical protein